MLADGDITKRDWIEKNVTLKEAERYRKYQSKKFLLREGILSVFFSAKKEETFEKPCKDCEKKSDENCKKCQWLN